ncbi:hypothetical protein ACGFSB_13895 [Streptomyces sp. NPDC048441]|uniref:hypothetical protein n=1 Tax=Streptomyces sp. NPDC048441 TaxID=3365552 RepID=UPI0037108A68
MPFLTTLALMLLAPIAFGLAGLSVMATDSCGPDDCSPQLMGTLDAIFVLLPIGGLVSLVSLVICWALPRRVRHVVRRRWVAMLAIAPQLLIILMVMGLPEG